MTILAKYIRRNLALLTLPYFRLELPKWTRMSDIVGISAKSQEIWLGAPTHIIQGKYHGYRMVLNLEDYYERIAYFLGRYYELGLQLFIDAAVQPGDSFVDIGANMGMVTLIAACRVGKKGQIHTFEPNPEMVSRIRVAIQINSLENITVYPIGVSDIDSELMLTVPTEFTGYGTFADVVEENPNFTYKNYFVPVRRIDDILPGDLPGHTTIKIDVEGFESRVLRGMPSLLNRLTPALVVEAEPVLLERSGSSVAELFAIMQDYHYQAYSLEVKRLVPSLKYRMILRVLIQPSKSMSNNIVSNNIVWLYPEGIHFQRLKKWMVPN